MGAKEALLGGVAGFAVGGPVGGAIGAALGFVASSASASSSASNAIKPVDSSDNINAVTGANNISSNAILPTPVKLSPSVADVIESKLGTAVLAEIKKKLSDPKLVSSLLSGGGLSVAAPSASAVLGGAVITFDVLAIALAVDTMFGGAAADNMGHAIQALFGEGWYALTPAQQKTYTAVAKKVVTGSGVNPGDMQKLIDSGALGAGTGSKQILIHGEYVTIGRTGENQYTRPGEGGDDSNDVTSTGDEYSYGQGRGDVTETVRTSSLNGIPVFVVK